MLKRHIIFFVLLLFLIVFLSSCVKNKCENINCNDNNLCTVDACNPETGLCSNTLKSCPIGQTCNKETGECKSTETVIDKIESAINEKISTSSNPMDKIEGAIRNSLP